MRFSPRFAAAGSVLCTLASVASVYAADPPQPFRAEPFTDVPSTSATFDAIEYLRTGNVLKGYPDGTFRPQNNITRSEFVSLMTNPFFLSGRSNDCLKLHFPEGTSKRVFFRDVARSSWYAQDVCEATVHELVSGYPDGTFKPQRYVIFPEAAKIATRLFAIDVANPSEGADWYVPYVKRMADLKAIPLSIKRMDQEITRGEMAEMLYRLKTGNNTANGSATYEGIQK